MILLARRGKHNEFTPKRFRKGGRAATTDGAMQWYYSSTALSSVIGQQAVIGRCDYRVSRSSLSIQTRWSRTLLRVRLANTQ